VLVISHHVAHRRVAFEQACGSRGSDHIYRSVPLGESREQGSGQDYVAQKGGLDY
jgi:hypothetical protein